MHLGNATISNDACSLSPRGTSGERVGERGSFPQFRRSLGCPSPHSFIVGKGNPLLAMVVVSTSVPSATPNRHEMVPLVKMLPNDGLEHANDLLGELLASRAVAKRSTVVRNRRKQVG